MRRFGHKLLYCEIVQVAPESTPGGPPYDSLRDTVLADKGCSQARSVAAGQRHNGRAQILRELKAGGQQPLALRFLIALARDVQHIELSIESFSQPCSSRNQVARLRAGTDAYRHFLRYGPVRSQPLTAYVIFQVAVHGPRHPLQGHFAQSNQVSTAKEIRQ